MNQSDITTPITIDPGNEEVAWILRCMVFTTGPISHQLRKLGWTIPRKVEDEQFTVILWMLKLHEKHGSRWRVEADNILQQAADKRCLVHADRKATRPLTIPCAPGGAVWVCEECADPKSMQAVFDAYKASHGKEITVYKQVNPGS